MITDIITYVNKSLLGDVKPVKDFLSNVKSIFVHGTNKSFDEFFVLEFRPPIQVKCFECVFNVNISQVDPLVSCYRTKILERKDLAIVLVLLLQCMS